MVDTSCFFKHKGMLLHSRLSASWPGWKWKPLRRCAKATWQELGKTWSGENIWETLGPEVALTQLPARSVLQSWVTLAARKTNALPPRGTVYRWTPYWNRIYVGMSSIDDHGWGIVTQIPQMTTDLQRSTRFGDVNCQAVCDSTFSRWNFSNHCRLQL